ncbi:MAG: flagellin [Thalassospira sp.]|uniref:flagellin n=2 Tax=Thalassospira sp. TaxID=1912094 RepID=UPI001AFE4CC0|nr:flagellin [Thalassospira sp.]MBO6803479.1 flagellin [Thalassospira sp.]MBO6819824.1 flagellin [Thalassospira sp.]MBO6886479.1 flagellin [Thalassospira sp.]
MALNIISDHAANLAHRNLARAEEAANRSLAKLSSGKRVVSARDDAASMAIGSRLNSTASALTSGIVNIGQGNSMLQIADGAMATIDDVLVRMNTLAVQAASENLSDTERGFLNDEFVALRTEINRIAAATNFNGIQLLGDGSDVSLDYSDLQAGGSAEVLSVANGFSNFTITDDNYWARDANENGSADNQLRFDILKTGDRILLSAISEIDGTSPYRTQSIDVTDYASGGSKALNAGQTQTLDFGDVGVKVNLNFNIATTIANALAQGSDGAGADGSTTAQIFGASPVFSVLEDQGNKLPDKIYFQLGGGNTGGAQLSIPTTAVDGAALGTGKTGTETSLDELGSNAIATSAKAQSAIEAVARAIDDLQRARANIGTNQNRLDAASESLASTLENVKEARSSLLDLDVAMELTNYASKQILIKSSVAMLARVSEMRQNLIRLLAG